MSGKSNSRERKQAGGGRRRKGKRAGEGGGGGGGTEAVEGSGSIGREHWTERRESGAGVFKSRSSRSTSMDTTESKGADRAEGCVCG